MLPHLPVVGIVADIGRRLVDVKLRVVEGIGLHADAEGRLSGGDEGLAKVVELPLGESELRTVAVAVDSDHGIVGIAGKLDALAHVVDAVGTEVGLEELAPEGYVEVDERLRHVAADDVELLNALAVHVGKGGEIVGGSAIVGDAAPCVLGREIAVDGTKTLNVGLVGTA